MSAANENAALAFGIVTTTGTLSGVAAFGDHSLGAWVAFLASTVLGCVAARRATVRTRRRMIRSNKEVAA